MKQVYRFYYWMTVYVPRLLPRNDDEFSRLKYIFTNYYDVADNAKSWATICGHITSVPSRNLRVSYGSLANSAKRLIVNEVSQKFRQEAMRALEEQLKEAVTKYQKENPQPIQEEQTPAQMN